MNTRACFLTGCFFAGLAVALGAFGAHVLGGALTSQAREAYQTAVRYQFFHALALFPTGVFQQILPKAGTGTRKAKRAGIFFTVGILLFSGSLYAWALGGPRLLGAVAPLGGACFLIGWIHLALASLSAPNS